MATDSAPIFEWTTSPLRMSNDGRLEKITKHKTREDAYLFYNVIDTTTNEVVLTTEQEVVASAYIAGYDLARNLPDEED